MWTIWKSKSWFNWNKSNFPKKYFSGFESNLTTVSTIVFHWKMQHSFPYLHFLRKFLKYLKKETNVLKLDFFLAVPLGLPGASLELTKTLGTSPGKEETLAVMIKKKEVQKKGRRWEIVLRLRWQMEIAARTQTGTVLMLKWMWLLKHTSKMWRRRKPIPDTKTFAKGSNIVVLNFPVDANFLVFWAQSHPYGHKISKNMVQA